MNKENLSYFFTGLFIGLVMIGGIFAYTQPPIKITADEKYTECIENGGVYNFRDWSLDDTGDYKITCQVPEKQLWQFEVN